MTWSGTFFFRVHRARCGPVGIRARANEGSNIFFIFIKIESGEAFFFLVLQSFASRFFSCLCFLCYLLPGKEGGKKLQLKVWGCILPWPFSYGDFLLLILFCKEGQVSKQVSYKRASFFFLLLSPNRLFV